jgi:predicted esterase
VSVVHDAHANAGMQVHQIAARTHGRYLVDAPASAEGLPLLVGFHGYAERAEDMLQALRHIRGERAWVLTSIQALNRFYTRSQDVVANWMTREDRELVIGDNIDYIADVVARVRHDYRTSERVVYAGFSQGVAMVYRALAFAAERHTAVPAPSAGILLAGDVPPDVVGRLGAMPPLLIGRGTSDDWYTEAKASADLEQFARAGVTPVLHVFDGGHVWHDSFVLAAGRVLDQAS